MLAGASGAAPYGGNKRQNPPPPEKKTGRFFACGIGDSRAFPCIIYKKESYATTNTEIRQGPERHGHAQHRRVHRVGIRHGALHPLGMVAQHPDGTPGRPDADLPAAVADRLYGRAQRRRRTRRGNRGHCRHGRHRRQRYPDVHRSHGHGPAGRVYDPVVRQTYAGTHKGGLRDAREQFSR